MRVVKSCLLFTLCFTVIAKFTFAASVPMVPAWGYYSPNNTDYRSFGNGTMTVNVTAPDTNFATNPRATYPAGQDFTVSVAFDNFSTQGEATNDTTGPSAVNIALMWDLDDGKSSQISLERAKFSDGGESFNSIYHDYGENYDLIHDQSFSNDSHTSGILTITKTGNSVTVRVKDTNGNEIHAKTYSSVFVQKDITVNLGVGNGSREATSVTFSNFDMNPVPINVTNFLVKRSIKSEESSIINATTFSVIDTSGNYNTENQLTSFHLFGPSGTEIPLANAGFEGYKVLYGRYDIANGQWIYGNNFGTESSYIGEFAQTPVAGDYHLVVNTNNGITYHRYVHFNSVIDLPAITSTSLYSYKDLSGNLHIIWDPPYNQSFIDANINTSARAQIDVYVAGVWKSEIWVNFPTHLGHIFIPNWVVQLYEAEGTDRRIAVQIRTNDGGQNRSYTKKIPLVLATGAQVVGDANGDGKVGLEEAINALKVTAGN